MLAAVTMHWIFFYFSAFGWINQGPFKTAAECEVVRLSFVQYQHAVTMPCEPRAD